MVNESCANESCARILTYFIVKIWEDARVDCIKTSQSHFSDNKNGILLNLRIFLIWQNINKIKMSVSSISKTKNGGKY